MPILGLGTWKSQPGAVADAVATALEAGYRHIDAAHIYLNQQEVGEGLRRGLEAGIPREEVWVTSKIWMTDFEPSRVGPAVDVLLQDLGLTYLDQVLLHWPVPLARVPPGCPPTCPPELAGTDTPLRPRGPEGHYVQGSTALVDTWRALEDVVLAGKVRSIGVSNFSPTEMAPLLTARIPPAVNQVECHPNWRQTDLKVWLNQHGIQLVAYSPLGNPAIYERGAMSNQEVERIAAAVGRTPAQVVLRWSLQKGNIVIPKSVTRARILANALLFDFTLNMDQMNILDSLEEKRLTNPPLRAGGRAVFDEL